MKDEVFYGKGIHELEGEYPDLYELVKNISDVVYDGYALDYKTQKLIAIGITASRADPRATKKTNKKRNERIGHYQRRNNGCFKNCPFNFWNACFQ